MLSYYKSRFHDYISHRNRFLFSFLCQQVNNTMVSAITAETCNNFSEFGVKMCYTHTHNKFSTDKPLLLHDCSNQLLKLQ